MRPCQTLTEISSCLNTKAFFFSNTDFIGSIVILLVCIISALRLKRVCWVMLAGFAYKLLLLEFGLHQTCRNGSSILILILHQAVELWWHSLVDKSLIYVYLLRLQVRVIINFVLQTQISLIKTQIRGFRRQWVFPPNFLYWTAQWVAQLINLSVAYWTEGFGFMVSLFPLESLLLSKSNCYWIILSLDSSGQIHAFAELIVRALFLYKIIAEFWNFNLVLIYVELQGFCLTRVRNILHAQVWIIVFPPFINKISRTLLANGILTMLLGRHILFKFMLHLFKGMPLFDFLHLVKLDLFLSINHYVLCKHHLLSFMSVAFLKINCLVFYYKLGVMKDRLNFLVDLFEIRA
jgi:hypothetical protein